MGRYTGPKGKINRRLGLAVYESAGATRALERRNTPPGMHTRRGKQSTYGTALLEKQKVKYFYGLDERALRRLFERVRRAPGNTGIELLRICERRLDNAICRAGLAKTRPQARQGIVHGHFTVNGRKVDKPSYLLRAGDRIAVKRRPNLTALYLPQAEANERVSPSWLAPRPDALEITVTGLPADDDIGLPVEVGLVVELLSR